MLCKITSIIFLCNKGESTFVRLETSRFVNQFYNEHHYDYLLLMVMKPGLFQYNEKTGQVATLSADGYVKIWDRGNLDVVG